LVVHKSGAREIGVRPLPSDNRAEPCRTRVGSGRSGGRLRGRVRVHRISVACGSALGITRRARSRRDCPKQKARQRAFHRRRPVRRDLSVENRHWIEGLFSFWQGTSLKWHGPKAYGGSGTVCSKPSEPRPRGRAGTQGTSPDQNSDHTSIAKPFGRDGLPLLSSRRAVGVVAWPLFVGPPLRDESSMLRLVLYPERGR
jgi:hypothetical protein